jgi:quercetin dioxygenase-like cupin family protein
MPHTNLKKLAIAFAVAGFAGVLVSPLSAQQAGIKRIPLQDQDLSVEGRHVVQAIAELDPGVSAGRHTHPGEEVSYILDGTWEITIEGKPPVTLKAGDPIFIPAGVVHDAKNVGTTKGRVLAAYIVRKGEPVASPAK